MNDQTKRACRMKLFNGISGIKDVTVTMPNGATASGFVQEVRSDPMSGRDTIIICRHMCGRDEDPRFVLDLDRVIQVTITLHDGTEETFS